MTLEKTKAWHSLPLQEVLQTLSTQTSGLSQQEAAERLKVAGFNQLRPPKKRGPLLRFLLQFHNILIYVLLMAAMVTAFLAHWVDTGVILGVVVINALIGVLQEGKAEKALDAIRTMLSHQASVRRDGKLVALPAHLLVPGDIVSLQSGDKVPADLRLITAKEMRIDESLLTGESVPAEKAPTPVSPTAPIGDRQSIAYSGTLVTYGQALGVVVATGEQTEIGRISTLLREVQTLTTPLLWQINQFARWLSLAIVALAAATFLFGIFVRHYMATEMFLAAVGLAVAAIPEGLPAIMTITLAIGVQRMAQRNAIIRRLPAVETLGSVSVICSDKTGTLTRNEMTVRSVVTADGFFEVHGTGYDPHGAFYLDGAEIQLEEYPQLEELTRAALLCNDAALQQIEGEWRLTGDPTEGALLTLGLKAGLNPGFEQEVWPRTDVIPFESEHRFMATLHHDHEGHGFVYLKGAPERVLEMCARQRMRGEDFPLDLTYWHTQMEAMASQAQRLLAIAFQAAGAEHRELCFADVEAGLSLLGVVGMIDPPRDEAITAVADCHAAGIGVKMITGDHLATARAVGAAMGIGDGTTAITGRELETLTDEVLHRTVKAIDVFARTSPEHKLRLVTALQADGKVVAMTGDGVNDAPALKRADVGIAMGHKGTEVSKEAAEMVLADDNFASIVNAVEEGRTVYDNLKKAILFILPTNGGEAMSILAAIALGRVLPITAVQILWVNMITAVTLALALAFEPAERDVMARPPRDPREPLLSGFLVWRIGLVSLILVIGVFGLFLWYRSQGSSIDMARTIAVNTLVLFEVFYLFNSRHFIASVISREGLLGNRYALYAVGILLVFQLLFTYAPPMQTLFATTAIGVVDWLYIIVVALSIFFLVELEKSYIRWRRRRHYKTPSPLVGEDRVRGK